MDDGLRFFIHFFNDKKYLFKTIMMAELSQMDEICNMISSQKGWYWGRYAPSERHDYLKRRLFVESEMYKAYTREYGCLKEKIPVYFYLYPNITEQMVRELGRQRARHDETEPQILMVKIQDLDDTNNVTFTLGDSLTVYWKKSHGSWNKV